MEALRIVRRYNIEDFDAERLGAHLEADRKLLKRMTSCRPITPIKTPNCKRSSRI